VRKPSSLDRAAGEPGTEPGRTKPDSSSRVPSPGGVSMTISVRAPGRPQTVSKNSRPGERPALDLLAQRHEEGGHDVESCDREADVAEAPYR